MARITAWKESLPSAGLLTAEERELMTYLDRVYKRWEKRVKAEGEAKGLARGKAEGKAEAVLAVLAARGLAVPAAVQTAVMACDSVRRLDAWVKASVTVSEATELLAIPSVRPRKAAPTTPRSATPTRRAKARQPAARKAAR